MCMVDVLILDKLPGSATWTVKDVQLECIHVAEQVLL